MNWLIVHQNVDKRDTNNTAISQLFQIRIDMRKSPKDSLLSKFKFKWIGNFELDKNDETEIESLVNSILIKINIKFNKDNIHKSINEYFFFTGIDLEDLTSAKSYLEYSFNNVKKLENSFVRDMDDIQVELKKIKFDKDMNVDVEMFFYWGDAMLTIKQKKKKVEIISQ